MKSVGAFVKKIASQRIHVLSNALTDFSFEALKKSFLMHKYACIKQNSSQEFETMRVLKGQIKEC